ncbi:MAG TPA: hypothetical protein VJ927_09425 [Actinomycetota bacterium]|nr:hypothetical protein [Actinomycetota bacterium]
MPSYQHQSRSCVVATAPSASSAEFIQITLAAHGITATMSPRAIYPSVDFVEGIGVFVQEEDEERANEILSALGLDTGRATG